MQNFKSNAKFLETIDGKHLIVQDISCYLNNTENYDITSFSSRQIELRYATGVVVDIYNFPFVNGLDSISIPIPIDKYIILSQVITLKDSIIPNTKFVFTKNIGYDCNVKFKRFNIISNLNCSSCNDCGSDKKLTNINTFIDQAGYAGRFYDGVSFNKYINLANKLADNY